MPEIHCEAYRKGHSLHFTPSRSEIPVMVSFRAEQSARYVAALLIAFGLSACSEDVTQLLVMVNSDLSVRDELTSV